jgi:choline dehydrogenase-like flavoprotein
MRHYNDLYAIDTADRSDNRRKEIAFSDFYLHQGRGLGTVQSFGRLPPVDVLLQSLRNDLDAGPWRAVAPALSLVAPVLRRVLARLVDTSTVLASVTEDLPYEDNHVALPTGATPNGPRLAIRYRLRARERERIAAMRALMAQALKPNRFRLIRQAENNAMLAHACGTCRFGDDPATSVLDRNNRAHGIDNLVVVDSSFFPSSAGINPALTVAANALRVATNMLGGDRRG